MMRNSHRAAALLFAGVLVATPLLAQRTPAPNPRVPRSDRREPERLAPDSLGRCLAVLDLTDVQKAEIRAAVSAVQPALGALHEQLRADREALERTIEVPSPQACTVGDAVLKVKAGEEAIESEMKSLQRKIEAALTAEQKLKFAGCLEGLGRPGARSHRGPR